MGARSPFHALIDNKITRGMFQRSGAQNPMVRRYVAGEQISDALQVMGELRSAGYRTCLDYLGPDALNSREIQAQIDQYHEAIKAVSTFTAETVIQLHLSGLGLMRSAEDAASSFEQILTYAAQRNIAVRIGPENIDYIDDTIALGKTASGRSDGFGLTLQSMMRRTDADLHALEQSGVRILLIKGTGSITPMHGYTRPEDIDRQFRRQMFELIDSGNAEDIAHAVCTHDPAMVDAGKLYLKKQGIEPDRFEFEFLYGVRQDLQQQLLEQGYRVCISVPYGENWYPYFSARIGEKPN